MIAAYDRINRSSNNALGFGLAWAIVAVMVFVAGLGFGLNIHPGATKRVPVVQAPASGAALVQAWGAPDQAVDGAQVSQGLAGTSCAVYTKRKAVVCYAP